METIIGSIGGTKYYKLDLLPKMSMTLPLFNDLGADLILFCPSWDDDEDLMVAVKSGSAAAAVWLVVAIKEVLGGEVFAVFVVEFEWCGLAILKSDIEDTWATSSGWQKEKFTIVLLASVASKLAKLFLGTNGGGIAKPKFNVVVVVVAGSLWALSSRRTGDACGDADGESWLDMLLVVWEDSICCRNSDCADGGGIVEPVDSRFIMGGLFSLFKLNAGRVLIGNALLRASKNANTGFFAECWSCIGGWGW